MKHFSIIVIALALGGCTVRPDNFPTQSPHTYAFQELPKQNEYQQKSSDPQLPVKIEEAKPREDNFDKSGKIVATTSRWIYNESVHAWEYVSSEETMRKLQGAWDSAKKTTDAAYNKAVQKYQEYSR